MIKSSVIFLVCMSRVLLKSIGKNPRQMRTAFRRWRPAMRERPFAERRIQMAGRSLRGEQTGTRQQEPVFSFNPSLLKKFRKPGTGNIISRPELFKVEKLLAPLKMSVLYRTGHCRLNTPSENEILDFRSAKLQPSRSRRDGDYTFLNTNSTYRFGRRRRGAPVPLIGRQGRWKKRTGKIWIRRMNAWKIQNTGHRGTAGQQ